MAATEPRPVNITDWLSSELDKKLASLPDDNARYRQLILLGNAWRVRYQRFADFGTQPFDQPHPIFGDLDAFDFTLLLADIDRRKAVLENSRAPA